MAATGKPVIALIHGFCFGAGVGLAAGADLRIAADDAVFSVPAARLGVGYPPTALRSLVALMGPEPVKRLFFAAGRMTASDALAAGFVGEVCPKAEADRRAATLAAAIAAGAPLTIMAAKRAIDAAAGFAHAPSPAELQALADACFASRTTRKAALRSAKSGRRSSWASERTRQLTASSDATQQEVQHGGGEDVVAVARHHVPRVLHVHEFRAARRRKILLRLLLAHQLARLAPD